MSHPERKHLGRRKKVKLRDLVRGKYQREPNEKKVREIACNFEDVRCFPLVISVRNRKEYVVDGWHRRVALIELGFSEWDGIIYENLNEKEEARLFVDLNERDNPVTVRQKFIARLVAGERQALRIVEIADRHGFEVYLKSPIKKRDRSGKLIQAVKALDKVYSIDDTGEVLSCALNFLSESFGFNDNQVTDAALVWGAGLYVDFAINKSNWDFDALCEKAKTTSAVRILQWADALYHDPSSGAPRNKVTCVAIALTTHFNKGKRAKNQKLPPFDRFWWRSHLLKKKTTS